MKEKHLELLCIFVLLVFHRYLQYTPWHFICNLNTTFRSNTMVLYIKLPTMVLISDNFLEYSFKLSSELMFNSFWNPNEFLIKVLWISDVFWWISEEFLMNSWSTFLKFLMESMKTNQKFEGKPVWISYEVLMNFLCLKNFVHISICTSSCL